jgi:hypothetical protein
MLTTARRIRRRVLEWLVTSELPIPPELRLDGREWFGDDLDQMIRHVLRVVNLTPWEATRPETLTRQQQDALLWAVLYTLGHSRRLAWDRELRADPLTPEEFAAAVWAEM